MAFESITVLVDLNSVALPDDLAVVQRLRYRYCDYVSFVLTKVKLLS